MLVSFSLFFMLWESMSLYSVPLGSLLCSFLVPLSLKEHCNPQPSMCLSPGPICRWGDRSLMTGSLRAVPMEDAAFPNTANPSLACVFPRSYLQVRAGHWWLKPSDGPQHGGCCFSSSSLAAEDAGQVDDLFQQCLILSYFSLCSPGLREAGNYAILKSD